MATLILLVALLYVVAGGIFGTFFLWRGMARIDSAARGAPWTFRLLLFPGVVLLWPWLARRWQRVQRSRATP